MSLPLEGEGAVAPARGSWGELLGYFFKLGWLAFGGPVGQIGLMHLECVERRRWLAEEEFVRVLNFCHVLPGPEATQMAIYLGYRRRGTLGGVAAGILFIFPGYLTLCLLGWIYVHYGRRPEVMSILWGFRPVGLALMAAAMWRIGKAAIKTWFHGLIAVFAFVGFFLLDINFMLVLGACAMAGFLQGRYFRTPRTGGTVTTAAIVASGALRWSPARAAATGVLAVMGAAAGARLFEVSWFFLKAGLFSFGGAYAVLPMIRQAAVSHYGWLTDGQMIDALALGETTPGPLISIGIFVGYLAGQGAGVPLLAASCATFWLFLPSFVFVLAGARFIDPVTRSPSVKPLLQGVTSGVVGLILAASLPIARAALVTGGTRSIDWPAIGLGGCALAALVLWKGRFNVVVVVLAGGLVGLLRALFFA